MEQIESLFTTELANRDEAWEFEFLRTFGRSNVTISSNEPITGPDGWPYLMVQTDLLDDGVVDSAANVVRWLSTRGVGLVVNGHKPMPDFVLTYGMIWNFRERGEFFTPFSGPTTTTIELSNGQELLTGAPHEGYLPQFVRDVMREFLKRQNVNAAKILMISAENQTWDLAVSLESLGSPPKSEHQGIAEAIAWFLPAHYSVALVSENAVPGFIEL